MKQSFFNITRQKIVYLIILVAAIYGCGRLYFYVTDGFLVSKITSNLAYNPVRDTRTQTGEERQHIKAVLSQPFYYLGKGCQSYVFASEDGEYVIKFIKYQHFRPQEWLHYVSFIPYLDRYRLSKIEKKQYLLDKLLKSWKLAYEELPVETGVMYVHLNKTDMGFQPLIIYDKIGLRHTLNLNDLEFMVQRRASMLEHTLESLMTEGNEAHARHVLDRLVAVIISEYTRGFADNDHALMQNTGVIAGEPVHVDVGQFIRNDIVKEKEIYHQELFSKMYRLRMWLKERYASLAEHLDDRLYEIMGEKFGTLKPELNKAHMGRIPNA